MEEKLRLEEEEQRIKDIEEQKIIQNRIDEEKRINDENERIKEWERNFDEEQEKKEEELLEKFNNEKIENEK